MSKATTLAGGADLAPAPARAEAFLLLARAFCEPKGEGFLAAFRDCLPDDLIAAFAACGLDARAEAAAVARAADFADDAALRVHHARLFLTPPAPAPLNAGLYLEGTVMGPAEAELSARYAAAGLEKAEGFRDLNDHVVAQLEFAAHLWGEAARAGDHSAAAEFVAAFPDRWAPAFAQAIAQAPGGAGSPYLPLARLLSALCEICAEAS